MPWRAVAAIVATTALAVVLVACGTPKGIAPVKPGQSKHWATDLPEFDVHACYPLERDWKGDAKLEAMWVAVSDIYPRLDECRQQAFFLEGEFEHELELALRVQPDHSVKLLSNVDEIELPGLRSCVRESLAMVELPPSSEPSGSEVTGTYTMTMQGSEGLMIDRSKLGTIVGKVRTQTLGACECFDKYKDAEPEDIKYKFAMGGDGSSTVRDVKLAAEPQDWDLAKCLAGHLKSVDIATYPDEFKASYRYKFVNSRAFDVERLITDAKEASNSGDFATARTYYNRVLAKESEHPLALEGLGDIALEEGNYEAARNYYERELKSSDEASRRRRALSGIGYVLLNTGNPEEAIDWFENALDEEDSWGAHLGIASANLQLENYDDAREEAHESRTMNPDLARAYVVEGVAAHGQGDSEAALELLHEATSRDLKDSASWNSIVRVYHDLGRHDEALAAFDEAKRRGLADATLYYNRGIVLQAKGDASSANDAFCKAAEMAPDESAFTKACED